MASSLNGTGITFSNATTLSSAPVTSIATGNGLSGGTITTTGTLVIAAPTAKSVGSYIVTGGNGAFGGSSITPGSTVAGSTLTNGWYLQRFPCCGGYFQTASTNFSLTGTWQFMGGLNGSNYLSLWVRTA